MTTTGGAMLQITQLARVDVPVTDRDEAIAFYTEMLGFSLVVDTPFGAGNRWVEVAPPGGGATVALVQSSADFQPGRMTGIVLSSNDPRRDHTALKVRGVDVDDELIGGDGTIPLLFFLRDSSKNQLMVIESY